MDPTTFAALVAQQRGTPVRGELLGIVVSAV